MLRLFRPVEQAGGMSSSGGQGFQPLPPPLLLRDTFSPSHQGPLASASSPASRPAQGAAWGGRATGPRPWELLCPGNKASVGFSRAYQEPVRSLGIFKRGSTFLDATALPSKRKPQPGLRHCRCVSRRAAGRWAGFSHILVFPLQTASVVRLLGLLLGLLASF